MLRIIIGVRSVSVTCTKYSIDFEWLMGATFSFASFGLIETKRAEAQPGQADLDSGSQTVVYEVNQSPLMVPDKCN